MRIVCLVLLAFVPTAPALFRRPLSSVVHARLQRAHHLRAQSSEAEPDVQEYLARVFDTPDLDVLAAAEERSRLFDTNGDVADVDDMDELALLYKLRKELGDADFKAIFDTATVSGPNLPEEIAN